MERYTPDPIHRWSQRYRTTPGDTRAIQVRLGFEQEGTLRRQETLWLRPLDGLDAYLSVQVYNRGWAFGASRIWVDAPLSLFEHLHRDFADGGPYAALPELMRQIYGMFDLVRWTDRGAPPPSAQSSEAEPFAGEPHSGDPRRGHHIGVDLGGSDLKVVALEDGALRFYAKQNWNPRTFRHPDQHLECLTRGIQQARQRAAFQNLDGLGISTAGVVVGSEIRLSGLGAGLSPQDFNAFFRPMAVHLSRRFDDVPTVVLHDGDAAALWASVDMGLTNVLGLALGTGLGAGYVDAHRRLTGALCEIGKCLVDMAPDAPEHIYNHTRGPALHFLSQNAVFRLAPQYGISLEGIPERAEKLRHVQRLAVEGDQVARDIFHYIGRRLAMALSEFHTYFGMDHVVLFGRVASGASGEWILASAQKILERDFPDLPVQVHLPTTPPGHDPAVIREFGQAIAAAYFSSLRCREGA